MKPVVLLTDFGCKDTFVGVLKGVIAGIGSDIPVIDLTHDVEPQNIYQASFLLKTSYSYFPPKSVFCVVVDPGVGSDRKMLCIKTKEYYFVGPDNGVLWEAANDNGIEMIISLENKSYFLDTISNTFHGRDIFAPVAAHIAKGLDDLTCLGPVLDDCKKIKLPEVETKGKSLVLQIIHIDRFGNTVLNMGHEQFHQFVQNRLFSMHIKDHKIDTLVDSYTQADEESLFLIRASNGFMEISKKNGDAATVMGVSVGDCLTLNS